MIETVPLSPARARRLALDERLAALGVAALMSAVAWARLSPAVRGVVWAEDGARFLTELTREGFWPTLFKPYTGYLQFWPRVLTELAAQAGLDRFAGAVTLVACLSVGAIGGGVYVWSGAVITSRAARLALAAAPVLVPIAPIEVLGNLANLHWFVLWGCAWLLLAVPRTRRGAVGLALLAASFALTEIQVAVLLPLMLIHGRSGKAWVVRAGLLAGLAAQITSTLLAPRTSMPDHLGFDSMIAGYLVNGPLALLVGDPLRAGALLADPGASEAVVAALPFAACAVYALTRGSRAIRVLVGTLLLTSLVTWFAALWMNVSSAFVPMFGYAVFTPDQFRSMSYYRYGFVPGLCLLGIAVVAAGVMMDRSALVGGRARGQRILGAALLVLAVGVTGASFTAPKTLRDGQPLWQPSLAAARAVCLAHPGLRSAQVAQAPATWASDLPCRVLR